MLITWVTQAREMPSRAAILALLSRVPDRNPAGVDAICREAAARILRVRRAENDYRSCLDCLDLPPNWFECGLHGALG